MGREERRQTVLPAPPRQALRVLFASAGEYFRSYHSAYTKDDACSVAPWDESRRRVVSFKKKLDVPAAVLKLLVSVTEQQELCDLSSDDAACPLVVTSTAWTKGFERFKTTTCYRFAAAAGNSSCCVLEQTVTCEAPPLGFGMQGLVEKVMCNIAAESLEQQMRCAAEFVAGVCTAAAASPLPGEPAVKTRTPRLKSVASMSREEAANAGASPLTRSASLKRGRAEEVSPTQYYDAVANVDTEAAAALADAASPVAGGLSRRQSLRRRVASPDGQ